MKTKLCEVSIALPLLWQRNLFIKAFCRKFYSVVECHLDSN